MLCSCSSGRAAVDCCCCVRRHRGFGPWPSLPSAAAGGTDERSLPTAAASVAAPPVGAGCKLAAAAGDGTPVAGAGSCRATASAGWAATCDAPPSVMAAAGGAVSAAAASAAAAVALAAASFCQGAIPLESGRTTGGAPDTPAADVVGWVADGGTLLPGMDGPGFAMAAPLLPERRLPARKLKRTGAGASRGSAVATRSCAARCCPCCSSSGTAGVGEGAAAEPPGAASACLRPG